MKDMSRFYGNLHIGFKKIIKIMSIHSTTDTKLHKLIFALYFRHLRDFFCNKDSIQ